MNFDNIPCLLLICVAVLVQVMPQSDSDETVTINECSSLPAIIRNSSRYVDLEISKVHDSKERSISPKRASSRNSDSKLNLTLRNRTCSEENHSCALNSCPDQHSSVNESICYCDWLCKFFEDCCYDYPSACNKTENESDLLKEDVSTWSCVDIGYTSYWMETKCLKSWQNVEIESLCINAPSNLNSSTYLDFIPVFGANNITYRNRHCAQCNYQTRFEFWLFNVSLQFQPVVENTEELIDFFVELYKDEVYNYIVPGTNMPRRECHKPISNCSRSSTREEIKKDCIRGDIAIVYGDNGALYKNKYCAFCNRESSRGCKEAVHRSKTLISDFYFTINFKYRSQSRGFSINAACRSKIYDHHLKECVESEDIVSPIDAPLDKYRVAVWFIWPYSKCNMPNMTHFLACLTDVDASSISHAEGFKKLRLSVYMIKFDVQLTLNQSLELLKEFPEVENDNKTAYSILKFLRPFTRPFSLHIRSKIVKVIKTSSRRLGCVGLQVLNSSDYSKNESNGRIYVHKAKRYYRRDQYFEDNSLPGVIKVCDKELPSDCRGFYREYELGEFQVQTNLSLYHNVEGVVYTFGQYTLQNNSVYICHAVNEDSGNVIRQFLTLVGLSLSIFCLVIVLLTYILFSQLRTASGKNIVNLTVGLVLLDVTWLGSPMAVLFRPLCITTAFVIQYFILLVHISMAKIAHDTLCMFTDPIAHQRKNSSGHLRSFFILWLIPFVFVTLCFILWYFNVLDIETTKFCWLSGRHVYIFVYIPVCLGIVFNILCFTRSISLMRQLEQNSQMLRAQRQEKSLMFIYIKISTLLGLGWASTFIAVLFPLFSFAFVVLTTFQGVYIFLAFGCKRNVLMLYRNLCGKP